MLILALKVSALALVAGGFKSIGDQMAMHLLQQANTSWFPSSGKSPFGSSSPCMLLAPLQT